MDKLLDIPISRITPNHRQPRTEFDPTELAELAASIKEHGVLQSLSVVAAGDGYELIAGERRWRASQLAGFETVPCVVKSKLDDQTLLEVAIVENVQRAGLSAAEEARAYEQLATEFGLSDEEIGQRVGKSRAAIANLRRLVRLPEAVLAIVGPGEGQIPQGAARTLSQIAKIKGATKDIEALARRLAKGDLTTYDAEDMQIDLVRKYALDIAADWDLKWLTTPVQVPASGGSIEIRDCSGCPYFVKFDGDKYCAEQPVRCYPAKRDLYAQHEIKRVSQATGIPAPTADDQVTPLQIESRDEARVKSWLKAKTPPAHLRLVRLIDQPDKQRSNLATYTIRNLLKSREVILASSDPSALRKPDDVPVKEPTETPAQKAKREATEEQARAERRTAAGLKRKAQHDIDWLGLNTAKVVAPQLNASGPTLEWLAVYTADLSPIDQWPAMRQRAAEIEQLLATTMKDRDALLKEFVLLNLIGHKVASAYDQDWHEDWDEALAEVQSLIMDRAAEDGLGLKLPRGWDRPPIHHTPSNCWHCGQFAGRSELSQRDRDEGWGVTIRGTDLRDVSCPECNPKIVVQAKGKTA